MEFRVSFLLNIKKLFRKEKRGIEGEFSFAGFPLFHWIRHDFGQKKQYFFCISYIPFSRRIPQGISKQTFEKKPNIEVELNKLDSKFRGVDFDVAFLFAGASGETFLTLEYLEQLKEKTNCKKPLLISSQKHNLSTFELFFPDIPRAQFHSRLFETAKPFQRFDYRGKGYVMMYSLSYFKKLESIHRREEYRHYYLNLVKTFGFDKDQRKKLDISGDKKNKIFNETEIVQKNKKFVILSKEAGSNGTLSDWFWDELEQTLKNRSIGILYNSVANGIPLSYMNILAEKAIAVIGVRSGLFDICYQKANFCLAYYVPFSKRPSYPPVSSFSISRNFSLLELPEASKIKINEIDIGEIGERKALEMTKKLIEKFDGIHNKETD